VFPKTDYFGYLAPMGGNILLGTLSRFKTLTKFPKELEGQRESYLLIKPIVSLLTIFILTFLAKKNSSGRRVLK
jgi:hypothetical protein